jgi:pSer/pThr/pTyr-binding forkhead associated (FHA) protein
MARLLIEESRQEIPLKPGLNRLGRTDDNDFQIPDNSVSSHHCEIDFNNGVINIRDLGSTNGTFLNDEPIQEAVLQPGQVLCLGTVRVLCEEPAPARPRQVVARVVTRQPVMPVAAQTARVAQATQTARPARPARPAPGSAACGQHPTTPAAWRCIKCAALLCETCVKKIRNGMRDFNVCPHCGSACVSLTEYTRLTGGEDTSFSAVWRGAFSYPLKKDGLFLLILGTVLFSLLAGANAVLSHFKIFGFIGLAYWITVIMSGGYFFSIMQNIVVSSTQGEAAMPDFPEITSFWDSMAAPFFRWGLVWVLTLGPGVAIMFLVSPYASIPVFILGLISVPMAILTVSLADSITGLNPIVIFSGIGKIPLPYLATCGLLLLILAVVRGVGMLLDLTHIPVLPTVISVFVSFYGMTVEMRLLGLLYFTNKRKLGWFS